MTNDLALNRERVANAIYSARQSIGLTLREVSRWAGVSPSQILRVESGEYDCKVDTLVKICGALGLNPANVMEFGTVIPIGTYRTAIQEGITPRLLPISRGLSPRKRELLEDCLEGTATIAAHIARSSKPLKLVESTFIPTPALNAILSQFAAMLENEPLSLIDRYDFLSRLRAKPVKQLQDLGLWEDAVFREFEAFAAKKQNQIHLPWCPWPHTAVIAQREVWL